MKIVFLQNVLHAGSRYAEGEEADVDIEVAEHLAACGFAVKISPAVRSDEPKAAKAEPTAKPRGKVKAKAKAKAVEAPSGIEAAFAGIPDMGVSSDD